MASEPFDIAAARQLAEQAVARLNHPLTEYEKTIVDLAASVLTLCSEVERLRFILAQLSPEKLAEVEFDAILNAPLEDSDAD